MSPKAIDEIEIAPEFTIGRWNTLSLDVHKPESGDWVTALEILKRRIRARFVAASDVLISLEDKEASATLGFAILALDFLVLETLQAFRDGVTNHTSRSKELITKFLLSWELFLSCLPAGSIPGDIASSIYSNYRCAILHSGGTGTQFTVNRRGAAFSFGAGDVVDSTELCFTKDWPTSSIDIWNSYAPPTRMNSGLIS